MRSIPGRKVLITGAGGEIGRSLRRRLRDRYDLRLMVHSRREEYGPEEDVVAGTIMDLAAMREIVRGCDAVVHLARVDRPTMHSPEAMLDNLAGSYNVVEACRLEGVKKLVFASTNHVTGMYERDGLPCDPDVPVRPDSYYGAGKAAVEALFRYYSDEYGISIVCLRIGSFLEKPVNRRCLVTWISPRDLAQLVWRSVESDVPWLIAYGISGNTRRAWSIESAQRVLGYAPEDDAERYAGEVT